MVTGINDMGVTVGGTPVPRGRVNSGLIEEEHLRQVLLSTGELDVTHNYELDCVYKLDAVVVVKNAPMLPAVGIQFTQRNSPEKKEKAMQVVRATKVVSRFLYLRCHAPMTEAAAGMLLSMVVLVAKMSSANGIVTAALERDGSGYYFTGVQCYPLG